ncbi:MAG: hypothetical protein NW216_10600 [Hyphomicrobium sp.]|nr:hypothetical protein [Hyphomicrobium sp.]
MSTIASANWLAIAGALYALCGVGFLAKAALTHASPEASVPDRLATQSRREVNMWFGLPILAAGFLMQAMGGMGAVGFNVVFATLMLLLAFSMLVFAAIEDQLADAFGPRLAAARGKPNIALLPSPANEPRVIEQITTRAVETALP